MNWFRNTKIQTKLFITFGMALIFLIALGILMSVDIIHIAWGKSLTYIIIAVGIILTVMSGFLLLKSIKPPVSNMKKALFEIANGNIAYPIRNKYNDELGQLSHSIADMVDKIAQMNKAVAVMDYLDTMICVADLNYKIIYANKKMRAVFDLYGDDLSGQKCYKVIKGLDKPCDCCPLSNILNIEADNYSEGIPGEGFDYLWHADKFKWFSGKTAIIRWTDGSLVQFHAITDVTETKVALDKHKEYESQLKKAIETAESASFYKTAFLTHMSQEIRTPMNSIVGFSELALDDDDISFKTREYLNKILDSSDWLLQVINDILDLSKIESDKVQLENVPFDLRRVFEDCQTAVMPDALEKDLTLYCYAEPVVGKKLIGDPSKLRQALLSIISNAVRFSDYGTIKVLSFIKNFDDKTSTLHFEIKDSGIGLTEEQIKEIFNPVSKTHIGAAGERKWIGLGLFIAKKIIELMGGELKVEAYPGAGSKFSFDLIFNTTDAPIDKSSHEPQTPELKKPFFDGEVLVCEDNLMNREVILKQLSKVGLKTEVAFDGKEALELVKNRAKSGEKQFDLIFMDIHMPVMDGVEAASTIFKMELGIPIVAMTAYIMSNDRKRYQTSGMRDCLIKPFSTQELWQCLLKYLKPVSVSSADHTATEPQKEDKILKLKLITDFVKGNQQTFNEIAKAIKDGKIQHAYMLVHALKNNAALIEQPGLLKAADIIEGLLKGGTNLTNQEDLNILEAELTESLKNLEPKAGKFSGDLNQINNNNITLNLDQIQELFHKLTPLLKSGNPECLKFIESLKNIPDSENLIEQMNDYDFKKAIITLEELKRNITV